jgi:hypothetical protein
MRPHPCRLGRVCLVRVAMAWVRVVFRRVLVRVLLMGS